MVKMKKTYKKKAIFSFLLVAVLMMCGCGNVNSDEAEASDSSETSETEEVSESEEAEEDTEAVCWIMETEKEKALTARGEYYSYEVASNDTENDIDNDTENAVDENTTDNITGNTTGNTGSTTTENSTDSSTSNSTTSKDSSTNESISKSTSGSSSSGSSSSSTGSSSTSGNSSSTSSSGSSSSGSSSGSSNKTTTTTTTEAASTVCSHSWKLTNTKAEEGYYTYHCTSSTHHSSHTGIKRICVCNQCGYTCDTSEEMNAHFIDMEDENGWLVCGSFTIKYPEYTIDNIYWIEGTATKSWVTTSKGVYTYTCSKCGKTKTETFTESHPSSTISFTIDPYNGEDVDSWLNSHYN